MSRTTCKWPTRLLSTMLCSAATMSLYDSVDAYQQLPLSSLKGFTSTLPSSHLISHPNNMFKTKTQLNMSFNNEDDLNGGRNIVLTDSFLKDRASLLESAFEAMDDKDKYDAVLTGLCSKILDGKSNMNANDIAIDATLTPTELAMEKMKDPIRLLEEMNSRKVKASGRSLMALVDVSSYLLENITYFVTFLKSTC